MDTEAYECLLPGRVKSISLVPEIAPDLSFRRELP